MSNIKELAKQKYNEFLDKELLRRGKNKETLMNEVEQLILQRAEAGHDEYRFRLSDIVAWDSPAAPANPQADSVVYAFIESVLYEQGLEVERYCNGVGDVLFLRIKGWVEHD